VGSDLPTGNAKTLSWKDVETAANEAFHIWGGSPELRWAREAWDALIRAGLATYENEVERCEAAIRFMALAALYHDFCERAWDEGVSPDYLSWAEELRILPFRMGQLVGREEGFLDDSHEVEHNALKFLADRAREEIVPALREGFHDIWPGPWSTSSGLFIALWRSREPKPDPSDPDEEIETDWEVVNTEITGGKLQAFAWLEDGCPPIL
jgi:hypothetical protein